MMKSMWIVGVLGVLMLAGCDNSSKVDTTRLEKAFAGSGGTAKENVGKVAAAVKAGNWAEAAVGLKEMARDGKLTAEQQAAIKDVAGQVAEKVKEAVAKGAAEAQKTAEELKKSLGK
ncbi:MAG: hypothetical protein NTU53_14025 [Planctomycetota bacterium]|nr:hypothetical protein [Planctomycetota bacterium]